MIAKGLFYNSYNGIRAFFRHPWDILDFIVLVPSILNLYFEIVLGVASLGSVQNLEVIRVFRSLRPLGIINKDSEIKSIFEAIFSALVAASTMIILLVLFQNFFILFSMFWFKGTFYSCTDIAEDIMPLIVTRMDCLNFGGRWIRKTANFDTFLDSFRSSLLLSTAEGWLDILNDSMDSVGINLQPQRYHRPYMALYIVGTMLVFKYLLHNFFLAIFIDHFYQSHTHKQIGDGAIVTDTQKQWIEVNNYWSMKKLRFQPKISGAKTIQRLYKFLSSHSYRITYYSIIVVHSLLMLSLYMNMTEAHETFIGVCCSIYLVFWDIDLILRLV